MNKKEKVVHPVSGGSGVVVASTPLQSKLKSKKLSLLIISVCLVMVLALAVDAYIVYARDNREKINLTKLTALNLGNKCSETDLMSVNDEKPTSKRINASIELLEYRGDCLSELGQYKQAINTYSQLQSYYAMNKDSESEAAVQVAINNDAYNIAHSNVSYNKNEKPDIDPALLSKMDALKNQK